MDKPNPDQVRAVMDFVLDAKAELEWDIGKFAAEKVTAFVVKTGMFVESVYVTMRSLDKQNRPGSPRVVSAVEVDITLPGNGFPRKVASE